MIIEGRKEIWDFQLQMKKALGIDLGEARVGVAISDDLGMLAHPLETIPARSNDYLERIVSIAADRQVESIIVGMPRNMDGSYGPAATKAREFIEKLKSRTPCRVIAWDERLTTVSAQRSLHEAGRNTKKQRPVIDQVAAQIILQGWLDSVG
jgi:putative Holliday junction resolvase